MQLPVQIWAEGYSEPDDDVLSLGVDLGHEADPVGFVGVVLLVDAHRVGAYPNRLAFRRTIAFGEAYPLYKLQEDK